MEMGNELGSWGYKVEETKNDRKFWFLTVPMLEH